MAGITVDLLSGKISTRTEDIAIEGITDIKQRLIVAVKYVANTKILSILPEWKQRNFTARSAELLEKKIEGTITSEEIIELNDIKSIWQSVKAIREASNQIEAEISNIVDASLLVSFNVNSNPTWPQET